MFAVKHQESNLVAFDKEYNNNTQIGEMHGNERPSPLLSKNKCMERKGFSRKAPLSTLASLRLRVDLVAGAILGLRKILLRHSRVKR